MIKLDVCEYCQDCLEFKPLKKENSDGTSKEMR